MQPLDNRSRLTGTVLGRAPHPTQAGFDVLDVEVLETARVDDRPDLLASTVGTTVAVTVAAELLPAEDLRGARLTCRAQRTPAGAVADRDPTALLLSPPERPDEET